MQNRVSSKYLLKTHFFKITSTFLLIFQFFISQSLFAGISDGLVAHYEFEGNANDTSGNGHNGVPSGGVYFNASGVIGNAASFDGIDDYVEVAGANELNPENHSYSVSTWIKVTDFTTETMAIIYNQDSWSNQAVALSVDPNGKVVWVYHDYNGAEMARIDTTYTLEIQEWYHIASIRNKPSSVSQVYINGFKVGEIPDTNANVSIPLSNELNIGRRGNIVNQRHFKGVIDDLRIYERAINADEISALYTMGSQQQTIEATAHYNFNNGFINSVTSTDDASKWDNSNTVIVQDSTLLLQNNYDGDPKRSAAYNIDTTSIDKITIEKRSKINAQGNYSLSSFGVHDGDNSVHIAYNYYHYSGSNQTGSYDNREHFYIVNTVRNNGNLISFQNSNLINTRFSQWIKEKLIVDYINKIITYTITDDNGSNIETLQLSNIVLDRNNTTKINFSAWDWANGTQHAIDDLTIYTKSSVNQPIDTAPIVANPIDDVTLSENSSNTIVDLTNTFTDSDNDDSAITKAVQSNSNQTLVTATITNGNTLTLNYQTDQTGTATIVIRGTSNGKTVDDTFEVTVQNINIPPTANAGIDQSVIEGEDVTLNASASSDSDGEIVSYEWKEGVTSLSSNPSFTKSDFSIGEHTITLKVTDNDGGTSTDNIVVTVNDVNPNSFSFGTALKARNSLADSVVQTITGISDDTPISIEVSEGFAQFQVNGGEWLPNTLSTHSNGAWQFNSLIKNNDTVKVRLISSGTVGTSIIATLKIGSVTSNFIVTSTIQEPIDSDEDNILDAWEDLGFVPIDTLGNEIANFLWDFDASKYGNNNKDFKPLVGKKDLYLWVDKIADLKNPLKQEALQKIKDAFENSKDLNGKNIILHITQPSTLGITGKDSIGIPFNKQVLDDLDFSILNRQLEDWRNHFFFRYEGQQASAPLQAARVSIYYYMLYGYIYKSSPLSGGKAFPSEPVNDTLFFISADGNFGLNVNSVLRQSSLIMHEFGHNLGLGHGGPYIVDGANLKNPSYINDYNPDRHRKPHYLSIMNYLYQTSGLNENFIDYNSCIPVSNNKNLILNEYKLYQQNNFLKTLVCKSGSKKVIKIKRGSSSGFLDWKSVALNDKIINWDGSFTDNSRETIKVNINGHEDKDNPKNDTTTEFSLLHIKSDWDYLSFKYAKKYTLDSGIISFRNVSRLNKRSNNLPTNISIDSIKEEKIILPILDNSFYLNSMFYHGNIQQNTTINYSFTIHNDGLKDDIYTPSFTSESNWQVKNLPVNIAVPAGKSVQTRFSITAPVDATIGLIDIVNISATSQTSNRTDSFTFYTKVVTTLPTDTDGDGFSDEEEIARGTNPNSADSDGDGIDDMVDEHPLIDQDSSPDAIVITDKTNINLNTWVETATYQVTGINIPVSVYIGNGEVSVDGGEYSSSFQTVTSGQSVKFRVKSLNTNNSIVTATVIIGDFSTSFNVKTSNTITDTTIDTSTGNVRLVASGDGNNLTFAWVYQGEQVYNDIPEGTTFPYGLVSFKVDGLNNGGTARITLYFPQDKNINSYYKKGNDGVWRDIAESIIHDGTNTIIVIQLTDGGNLDLDGTINGSITDPGGPVNRAINGVAIPTLSIYTLLFLILSLAMVGIKRKL